MLQITQRRQEGTLIAVYTGELDHHAARAAIEQICWCCFRVKSWCSTCPS